MLINKICDYYYFCLSNKNVLLFQTSQNWFTARVTKWRKEEGFVPIAERAAILAQNMNKSGTKE